MKVNDKKRMSDKSFGVRYRQNAYARKRMKVIIIIAVSSVLVLALALMLIGNILKSKSESQIILSGGDKDSNATMSTSPHASIGAVNAYAIALEGLSSSELSGKFEEIRGMGGNAVCFRVRNSDGRELYKSAVAQDFYRVSDTSSLILPERLSNKDGYNRLYSSACIDVYAFSEQDAARRSVKLAYDAAIGAELIASGFDDVIFRIPEINADNIDEVVRIADTLKSIHPSAAVGVSFTRALVDAESSSELVARLWDSFDFISYDLALYKEGDAESFVVENTSAAHYYLLRYNARVLLPSVDEKTRAQMLKALSDKGITNWQIVG